MIAAVSRALLLVFPSYVDAIRSLQRTSTVQSSSEWQKGSSGPAIRGPFEAFALIFSPAVRVVLLFRGRWDSKGSSDRIHG